MGAQTHHNEQDEVDPVPERVGILDKVHHVSPALQTYHLKKWIFNAMLTVVKMYHLFKDIHD